MTIVIDWTKAPHDATHMGVTHGGFCWYKDIKNESYDFMYQENCSWHEGSGQPSHQPLIKRPAKPGIDLKTLNVTFGELDLETQLRLVKFTLEGGKVSYLAGDSWRENSDSLHFTYSTIYRAAWTESDTIEADIKVKLTEINELYNNLINLQDKG